ncbi:MAG: DUF1476 domain-containing protein [Alphaproteobacteria bacterium]|nr:MAG: DUF1476 domain-containing protein [Alphaproteobacteria bacterium]
MSQFDNREKAFEAKYARDEELSFNVMARRNKLLGLWAAEKMGMSPSESQDYAIEVVKSDFEEEGDHDVFRKVKGDLDAKQVDISDHQVRREMEEQLVEAKRQVMEEGV